MCVAVFREQERQLLGKTSETRGATGEDDFIDMACVELRRLDGLLDVVHSRLVDAGRQQVEAHAVDASTKVDALGETLDTALGRVARAERALRQLGLVPQLGPCTSVLVADGDLGLFCKLFRKVLYEHIVDGTTTHRLVVHVSELGEEAGARCIHRHVQRRTTKVHHDHVAVQDLFRGIWEALIAIGVRWKLTRRLGHREAICGQCGSRRSHQLEQVQTGLLGGGGNGLILGVRVPHRHTENSTHDRHT